MSYNSFRTWQGTEVQFLIYHEKTPGGDAVDVTNATGRFLVKENISDDDSAAVYEATTADGNNFVFDGLNGIMKVRIPGEATEPWNINYSRVYYCQNVAILSTGQYARSATFRLILYQGAIKTAL